MTASTLIDLKSLARAYEISPALALGLGAGVYFEYFRRPQPAPTRSITGLNRVMDTALAARLSQFHTAPRKAARAALHENALWFNLDRQPTTALLGMEMLAEELVYYDTLPDWRVSFQAMARAILDGDALYRRAYASFLQEMSRYLETQTVTTELLEIADEWSQFAMYLEQSAVSERALSFEQASRLVRRLAFREEHFWGKVLDL